MRIPSLTLLTILALSACSESSANMRRDANDTDFGGGASDDDGDWNEEPPAEVENDFLAMAPSQTDVYVFVANPARNTVTRIDVFTLDVKTVEVGVDPRIVRVTPDYDHAAVFNRGDDSVSIVESETLGTTTVPVRDNFNSLVMSPDGAWVGLFHSRAAERPDDPPPNGIQSFNEVSFVKVPEGTHHGMAVSYNPRNIVFSEDGTLAIVVSDEDVALVDLTAEILSPVLIPIGEELDPPEAEEVVLSPSGRYAYVRQFGASDIVVVDLTNRETSRIPVGSSATDLDLSPDGSQAVVVSRAAGQVWVYQSEAPELPPQVLELPDELLAGSLIFEPSGDHAVLFTTAADTRNFAIWNTTTNEVRVEDLVKPISAMAYTPTGDSLMVLHDRQNSPDMVPSDPFYDKYAISLVEVSDRANRKNSILLPAEPIGFANAGDGRNGYFIMDGYPSMVEVDYASLLYSDIKLKSPPVYVGVLPDLDDEDDLRPPAWASQEHELGRISFFHPDAGELETITGFELNNRIEE